MEKEYYHFIGIGGIGMSALARILLQRGCQVKGSDLKATALLDSLKQEGAEVRVGHTENFVEPAAKVIYSTEVSSKNPEYQKALSLSSPLLHRSELLALLMENSLPLLVTGTHGKTTTSSLLTTALMECGLDPSFAVGGILHQYKTNGHHGKGRYFVAEADESDGSFLRYPCFGAIVTNLEREHIDYWKTEGKLVEGFKTFFSQISSPSHCLWCADDPMLRKLSPPGVSYGFSSDAQLRILRFRQEGFCCTFDLLFEGREISQIVLPLTGRHNACNGAAIFGLCLKLGLEEEAIRSALFKFRGVRRRLEFKGEVSGVSFYDDYGHHPTEIKSTLCALRDAVEEKKLWVLFQPHRYSRTKDLLEDFPPAFDQADEVIVTDIYGAQETPIEGLHSLQLVALMKRRGISCQYIPEKELVEKVAPQLRPHDVVVMQGAGSISSLGGQLIEQVRRLPVKKWKVGMLFGGRSSEHEISLISAENVHRWLDPAFYDVRLFGMTKTGKWIEGEESFRRLKEQEEGVPFSEIAASLQECEICFPVLHGPYGEDGMVQGFLDTLQIDCVGCDYSSSALCMNKVWTKLIALSCGIRTSPFIQFSSLQWTREETSWLEHIQRTLHFPLYVKPVHLGSSVGVRKAEDLIELKDAICFALQYDHDLLVEEEIVGREIEFAVLGTDYVSVAVPGEILTGGKCYDYEKKYGPQSMATEVPAQLPPDKIKEGQDLAQKIYQMIRCTGMARVDFFFDHDGNFWLSEINPIPGFTAISLYPKMWEKSGLEGKKLVDRLLVLARHRGRKLQKIKG